MILSRVIEHMKHQHWTAVFLDFLIVVVGVFIGLQVNTWNEARHDRALERQYLVRLYHDINQNQEASSRLAKNHLRRATTLKALWMNAKGLRQEPPSPQEVRYALCRWFVMPVMRLQSSTYEELVSTGSLTLVRDQELRQLIQFAYAEHANTRRQINLFGNAIHNLGQQLDSAIEWQPLPESQAQLGSDTYNSAPDVTCRVNLEKLKKTGIPSVLAQLYRAEKIFGAYRLNEAEADKRAAFRLTETIGSEKRGSDL